MSGPHTEDPKMFDCSYVRDRAIADLLAFGAVDEDTAGQLLRLWKYRNRLSDDARAAVLDWFRDNPVQPPYAIVDQGIGGWASGACAGPTDDDDSAERVLPPANAFGF